MHYSKNDPKSIRALFDNIATNYDRTNAILSFQMHKRWNAALVRNLALDSPKTFLDVCGGTGEILFTYLKNTKKNCHGYLLDFSPEMINCAQLKSEKMKEISHHKISYICADACAIPLEDNSMDCVSIAYGIRNVKDPTKCFQEINRVLRPGGTLGILELTQPSNPLIRRGHSLYLRSILPLLGKFLTKDKAAYDYLCNSIHHFIKPKEMMKILEKQNFVNSKLISLHFGVASIIITKKQ